MSVRWSRAWLMALLWFWPALAGAQYFGRNKVQYRSFDFAILRTEHFDVYYYQEERQAALDAARIAERSYARLSRLLQHEFRERKPLVLYASHSEFQQTNISHGFIDESTGAFAEAVKSRMVVPFTGSFAEFDHVFTHELVHAFQYDVILRPSVLTDATTPFGRRLPLWFMEGMAEYLSIGRIDPLTISWLRDATLHGYLRDIAQMSARDDYLSYRFGQSLWQHIGARWGDEVVGILLQKTAHMGIERAFATTLGLTLEQLSGEWSSTVRKAYLPQVAEFSRPSEISQPVTRRERLEDPWFLAPALSPDGRQMVYLSQRDGFFFDLWLADAHTGKPLRKLVSGSRSADFESLRFMTSSAAFSPDGRQLAFVAQTGGRDALYLYDLRAGRVARKLTFALDALDSPSFSPDGQQVVFSGNSGGQSDLYISDLQGQLTRLTHDRHADLLPAWSPDGRTIAFSTDRGPGTDFDRMTYGNYRVALYQLESQQVTVLPGQEQGKNINPVWAPDGASLVWVNDASGSSDLHIFDLAQHRLSRITRLLSGIIAIKDASPVLSWSRSGRLLYTYFEKAGYTLYALNDPRTLPRTPLPGSEAVAALDQGEPAVTVRPDNGDSRDSTQSGVTSYYRAGSGFRPSEVASRSRESARPVSVMSLLDSATLALADTAEFGHRDYRVRFTPDAIGRPTVGAQVGGHYGNGIYGSSYVALSDMLGNHNILLAGNINGSLSDASFLGGYSFLRRRANFAFSLEQTPFYRYYGSDYLTLELGGQSQDVAAHVFVRDVVRTLAATASYPFSVYRRLELGASAVYYKSDLLYRGHYLRSGDPLDHSQRIDKLGYVQPSAALVFDNSLFGWTGPIQGRRYRAQVSRTLGSFALTEGLLDLRNYWNYKQHFVLATRITGLARFGADARRFGVYWGGPYYIRGYDANSFHLGSYECNTSRALGTETSISPCPLRDQLIGSSAAFVNSELRVPIIKEVRLGALGALPPVDLVTFFDGGLAWDDQVCLRANALDLRRCAPGQAQKINLVWQRKAGQDPYLVREPVFAYGLGLRLNIFYTILRLDYTLPLDRPERRRWSEGLFSVSFGPSF